MANKTKWDSPTSSVTLLSCSTLDNLANAARKISGVVSNDAASELFFYADFKLRLSATSANRTAGAHCRLFIVQDLGGDSAYTFGSSSLAPPPGALRGNFNFDSAATAARINHLQAVLLPPANFKVLLENRLGVLFTSCTQLSMRRYHVQST